MSFSYGEDLTNDVDFVRFKTGDVHADKAFLSDEVIASLLTTTGSKALATLAAVAFIITQLSQPDFKADWLEVKNGTARAAYEKLLTRLEAEFGVTAAPTRRRGMRTRGVNTYRGDSETVSEPDYSGGRRGASEPGGVRFDYWSSVEYAYALQQQAEGRGDE